MIAFRSIQTYNTALKTFEENHVYVKDAMIWYIGPEVLDADIEWYDGKGLYIIPGLIDMHMHIESSMTTPSEFSNKVLPMGTTTILADAHEVANALGMEGLLDYMSYEQKMDIFYAIPSSVPSSNPHLETTKACFDAEEVNILSQHPKIRALGEIMNFSDVVSSKDSRTKRIVDSFQEACPLYPIEGHIPKVSGFDLARFAHRGIGSDHTQQSVDSLLEKVKQGFLVQIQEKSMHPELFKAIQKHQIHEWVCFVTDDVLADDLLRKGHMDHLIRKAVSMGMPIEDAIYASTWVPARRMRLEDRGILAPGKKADAIILKDLDQFEIVDVLKDGHFVSKLKKDPIQQSARAFSESILRNPVKAADFTLHPPVAEQSEILLRVMDRDFTTTFTTEKQVWAKIQNNRVDWKAEGLSLLCVLERYGKQRPIAFGFVDKAFKEDAAIATSWTHDHHNILVMGRDEAMMAKAVNDVIEKQGAMSFVSEKQNAIVPLNYGGVVSFEPLETIANSLEQIREGMIAAGFQSHNEIMSFSVMALLVSPSLKLSDRGYIDVRKQKILPWWVK